MPEQGVLGINLQRRGVRRARLPIHGAGDHEPVNRLEPPTALDEPARKVVQQLRMRRARTEVPEIMRRAHQTLPEVMMPQAIDNHARK